MIALKNIDKNNAKKSLDFFRLLAEKGNVPSGVGGGHRDGWGMACFEQGKIKSYEREASSAFQSDRYDDLVENSINDDCEIIIGHLRKASVGNILLENAHPFHIKNLFFCQNGTIFKSEEIELKDEFENLIHGNTDSERFFAYMVQLIENKENGSGKPDFINEVITEAISHIKNNFDYTAINFILTDGKNIWALREINEKNKLVQEKNMLEYYTLYLGKNKNNDPVIISSEKMDLEGIAWEEINNHKLIMI